LTAEAGSGDYGVLTLLVQLRYEPRGLFRIPAGCFHPAPDVDSGCIVLDLRSRELLPRVQRDIFVELVKRAFSQRRKMMFKLLKPRWGTEELDAAFAAAELAASTRAEDVTLQQFVRLTRALSPQLRHDE
jgi:16S rRNA (adenine1518-N6/adenine1519-N6)-dimethyltransferase